MLIRNTHSWSLKWTRDKSADFGFSIPSHERDQLIRPQRLRCSGRFHFGSFNFIPAVALRSPLLPAFVSFYQKIFASPGPRLSRLFAFYRFLNLAPVPLRSMRSLRLNELFYVFSVCSCSRSPVRVCSHSVRASSRTFAIIRDNSRYFYPPSPPVSRGGGGSLDLLRLLSDGGPNRYLDFLAAWRIFPGLDHPLEIGVWIIVWSLGIGPWTLRSTVLCSSRPEHQAIEE